MPFGDTAFHIGIHNLPSATGAAWMERLAAFTALPVATREPQLLREVLAELGITSEKIDELAKGDVISTPGG